MDAFLIVGGSDSVASCPNLEARRDSGKGHVTVCSEVSSVVMQLPSDFGRGETL